MRRHEVSVTDFDEICHKLAVLEKSIFHAWFFFYQSLRGRKLTSKLGLRNYVSSNISRIAEDTVFV